MLGIYIHVPFCRWRCNYCDFCSSVSPKSKISAYTEAMIRNIIAYKGRNIAADTVYFGGGTPSLLSGKQLAAIMEAVTETFSLTADAEITMEANPGTVTKNTLSAYKSAGINRISFGVQSAVDEELSFLGRLHSFNEAKEAVLMAKECGIDNISCDLMMGIPLQTRESLKKSVVELCELDICHISAYMLKIEEGTAFDCPEIRGLAADDDRMSDMYLDTVRLLTERGFEQYEISNFAKNGRLSRHNYKYWTGEDYLGFGPSAHSLFEGGRFFVPDDIDGFISSSLQEILVEDDNPDRPAEYIMLGLRLAEGISLKKLDLLGGSSKKLLRGAKKFEAAGLMKIAGNRAFLTAEGFLVSNGIIGELIER